jgi:hypothetical protein
MFNVENLFDKPPIKQVKLPVPREKSVEGNGRITNENRLIAKQLILEYLQRIYKLLKATKNIDN